MITSPSQYDFVTDLSGVIIDGGIMPARDAAVNPQGIMQPKCLRGEDIAFLAECAGERNTVMAKQLQGARAYDRRVSAQQVADIRSSLISYIHAPTDGNDCFYVMPDFQFEDKRASVPSALTSQIIDAQIPLLTHAYPDCCMSSVVSQAPQGRLIYSNEIRGIFRDAKNTRVMVPDGNCNNFSQHGWRPPAQGNITEVNSSFTRSWHSSSWTPDPGTYINLDDTMTFFQVGYVGYRAPGAPSDLSGGYGMVVFQPSSMDIKVQADSAILPYVDRDVSAVVCVFSEHDVVSGSYYNGRYSYSTEQFFDIWGFPIQTRMSNSGVVSLTWDDLQSVIDKLDTYTSNNYPEYGWQNNKLMSVRFESILGIPIVMKLTDHTDFSHIPWT